MQLAYLDEAGIVTPFQEGEWFLVVTVVVVGERAKRAIELHVKRLRRAMDLSRTGGELKAALASREQRMRLLSAMAQEGIAIVAVVVDKREVYKEPEDPEDWYRAAVSLAVRRCVRCWPELRLILDKRYTKKALRDRLVEAIGVGLESENCQVEIQQVDSRASLNLQATDYVAWAIRHKYEAGDSSYFEIIKGKVIAEKVLKAK